MKVMIAGGGTGGHLYIGIALAREIERRDPAHDCLFVGTRQGLESSIVPAEGFRLETIVSAGLKGMGVRKVLRSLALIPGSILQSRRLIRKYDPDVVVGVGGYSAGPVVLAAAWLRKPTMIIEPNAHPGLANRWLACVIDRAALALPDKGCYFGLKAVVTGIPVREEFRSLPRPRPHSELRLLIYGGSQGSRALNSIVCDALPELRELSPNLLLIHQTGERDFAWVSRAYREAGVDGDIRSFLPRIFEQFAETDLILSRAGAGTVAEITVAGKAAILVPFPGAADDHQTKNALALHESGAARMIPQQAWVPGRLAKELRFFLDHPGEIERMEQAARRLARPDAAQRIADIVQDLTALRN